MPSKGIATFRFKRFTTRAVDMVEIIDLGSHVARGHSIIAARGGEAWSELTIYDVHAKELRELQFYDPKRDESGLGWLDKTACAADDGWYVLDAEADRALAWVIEGMEAADAD